MSKVKKRTSLRVDGMHCASCVSNVEKSISKVPSVSEVSANLLTSKAVVEYDTSQTRIPELIQAVEKAGYKLSNLDS